MNVMLDLVAEIVLHLGLNLLFIERIDRSGINAVFAGETPDDSGKAARTIDPAAVD